MHEFVLRGNERRTSFRRLSQEAKVDSLLQIHEFALTTSTHKVPSSLSDSPKVESPLSTQKSLNCKPPTTMARIMLLLAVVMSVFGVEAKRGVQDFTELGIGVKFKPDQCHLKAHKGDLVSVHYRGTLADGTEFDNSHTRGQPLDFKLGQGAVIKGWDQGILGMCVGERRKLKIPAKLAYGDESVAVSIPAGASLIFDTELVAVNGRTGPGPLDVVEELLGDISVEDLEFGDSSGSF